MTNLSGHPKLKLCKQAQDPFPGHADTLKQAFRDCHRKAEPVAALLTAYMGAQSQNNVLGNHRVDDHTSAGVCRLVMLLVVASKLSAAQHLATGACLCIAYHLQLVP